MLCDSVVLSKTVKKDNCIFSNIQLSFFTVSDVSFCRLVGVITYFRFQYCIGYCVLRRKIKTYCNNVAVHCKYAYVTVVVVVVSSGSHAHPVY